MLLDLAQENQQFFAAAPPDQKLSLDRVSLARFCKSNGDLALARTIEFHQDHALPGS